MALTVENFQKIAGMVDAKVSGDFASSDQELYYGCLLGTGLGDDRRERILYLEVNQVNYGTQVCKARLIDPNRLLEAHGALKEVDLMNGEVTILPDGGISIKDIKEDSLMIGADRVASIDFGRAQ